MRLIIDIPDEQYEYIKKSDKNTFAAVSSKECMLYAIKNGTPVYEHEKSQGECKNCKHFKKSLCENSYWGWCSIRRATQEGDLETQVPKDYYCSWFEEGGAE